MGSKTLELGGEAFSIEKKRGGAFFLQNPEAKTYHTFLKINFDRSLKKYWSSSSHSILFCGKERVPLAHSTSNSAFFLSFNLSIGV